MAKVLCVANQKGGVGKTTTALNLAACLSYAGKRVLLIDLDAQGNATSGVGAEKPARGGAELLFGGSTRLAAAARVTRVPNLGIIPSSPALREVERELARDHSRDRRLLNSLQPQAGSTDFVILDCPPSLGVVPLNALVASHAVIIPIQCEYYAMEGLAQMLSAIAAVRKEANRSLALAGILLTMWDGAMQLALDVESEVRSHFPEQVYRTVIPRDPAAAEAPSHGLPIIDYAPRSKAASSYVQLTKEVLANETAKVG